MTFFACSCPITYSSSISFILCGAGTSFIVNSGSVLFSSLFFTLALSGIGFTFIFGIFKLLRSIFLISSIFIFPESLLISMLCIELNVFCIQSGQISIPPGIDIMVPVLDSGLLHI